MPLPSWWVMISVDDFRDGSHAMRSRGGDLSLLCLFQVGFCQRGGVREDCPGSSVETGGESSVWDPALCSVA